MRARTLYLWNKAPALRLLLPLAAGIVLQWYSSISVSLLLFLGGLSIIALATFPFIAISKQYALRSLQGVLLHVLMAVAGALLVYLADIRNSKTWFGNHYQPLHLVIATLQEPIVEKPASYKALATVNAVGKDKEWRQTRGKVILYFQKKDGFKNLTYGQQVLIAKTVQPIKNSGNPGGFDYERYSLFQGITHQAYVTEADIVLLPQKGQKDFKTFLFWLRAGVLQILRTNITGATERGLAEALLIGYKDDLDKTLLQAYANTGVVHVIAISGLHLGLIYGILLLLTKPLRGKKWAWLRAVIIIAALWLFTLLAGAQASVVRSAVMFTTLALGAVLNRNTSIYNTLALSALLLLLYNPFWLWDVGFQLSYAAVLSIIIFFKPVYNWLYFQNKLVDAVWKLLAVTLAAQILTTPFSLYYFHQFPLLFFITTIVAVPLSSAVLIGEIVLCAVAFIPPLASALGWLLTQLIFFLNNHILQMNSLPFASWQNLAISFWQAVSLLVFIAGIGYWLLKKNKQAFQLSLVAILLFALLRTASFIQAFHQKKIIVYNIPKTQAIDILDGRNLTFVGDEKAEWDNNIRTYHLLPSRVQHRAKPSVKTSLNAFNFHGHKVLVVDSTLHLSNPTKPLVSLLILSKNPKIYINDLYNTFDIKQVVIDASVPAWKAKLWQKDCDSLNIPCHNVTQKGAFVLNL